MSKTLDRKSYLYIKHHFSVQSSVDTLFNKEIKYTINVSYYYLQGGVSTTLRNGVLGWDLSRHSSSTNVCVQILSTRLSVNSRIDENTRIQKCRQSGVQSGTIKIFFRPQESNK